MLVDTTILLLIPESLHELEDNDLDALMADLVADLNATEEKLAAEIEGLKAPSLPPPDVSLPPKAAPSAQPVPSHASVKSPACSTYSDTSPVPPSDSQAMKTTKVCPPVHSLSAQPDNIDLESQRVDIGWFGFKGNEDRAVCVLYHMSLSQVQKNRSCW